MSGGYSCLVWVIKGSEEGNMTGIIVLVDQTHRHPFTTRVGAKVQIHSFTALIRCLDNSAITSHKAAFQIILLLLLHDYKGKTQRQKHPGTCWYFCQSDGVSCAMDHHLDRAAPRSLPIPRNSLSVRFTTWRLRTRNNHQTTLGRDAKIRVIVALRISCQCSWVNRQVLSQAGPWVERTGSPKG